MNINTMHFHARRILAVLFPILLLAQACGSDEIDPGNGDVDQGTTVESDASTPDTGEEPQLDMGTTDPDMSQTEEPDYGLFDFGNPVDMAEDMGPIYLSITDVLPSRGTVDGGTPVIIEGTGFSEQSVVYFGAQRATLELVDGSLVGQTPSAPAPGPVTVKVLDPAFEGPAILADGFTYVSTLAVDSVLPTQVPTTGGVELTLNGRGFDSVTRISLGGTTALRHDVVSPTVMRIIAPPRAVAEVVDLRATNRDSTVVLDDAVTYFAPLELDTIRPASSPDVGGINVDLAGSGFENGMVVEFGGIEATIVSVDAAGEAATLTVPAHGAGLVDVSLRSSTSSIVADDAFYYYAQGASLAAAAVDPESGVAAGGTEVTIVGNGLDASNLSVEFGGIPATIVDQGPGHVTVQTPAHAPGTVDITVSTGVETSTLNGAYDYVADIWVDRVTPASGSPDGGYDVVIEGEGFTGATRVYFGDIQAPAFNVDADDQITATAPAHSPAVVDVTVERDTVSATFVDAFAFTESVEVYGMIPARGSIAGNTYVTIFGRGFTGNVDVTFDGAAALGVEVLDSQTLAVRTPPHPSGQAPVEVSNSSSSAVAPDPYTYFNPGARFGGAWGPPIQGSVNVTVFEMGGAPIESAFVMLSTNGETPYQGYTDANGMVTLSGPDVYGEQTITAVAAGYSSGSVQKVDAENVTIFLNPPPEPNMGDQPPGALAMFTGKVTGLTKLADPGPHEGTIAIVTTTQSDAFTENPDPGGGNVVSVDGEYRLNSRIGDVALIAVGGIVDHLTGEFEALSMGVSRYHVAADGQTYQVDINLDIPLDKTLTFKLDNPPLAPTGPDINQVTPWLDFGFEGVFGGLPPAEGTSDIISTSSMPALSGDLQGVVITARGGSVSTFGGASSNAIKRNITGYSQIVAMPPLLGIPRLVSPRPGTLPVDNTFIFRTDSTNSPDFFYAMIVDFNFTPVWDVFLPGDATSFKLPDFPDFSSLPLDQQPTPYPSGQYILQIISISSPGFDYNQVSYGDLSLEGWDAYAANGFLILL